MPSDAGRRADPFPSSATTTDFDAAQTAITVAARGAASLRALAPLLYLGIAAAMMAPGLTVGPSLDAAVFDAVGWRVAAGDALYADVWDHKPPGTFLPAVIGQVLAGTPQMAWLVTWLLGVAAVTFAAVAVERTLGAAGVGGARYAAAVLAAFGLSAYLLTLGGGLSETFAVVPAAGAAWAVAGRARRGPPAYYLAGLLGGIAAAVSLQLITVFAFLAVRGLHAMSPSRVAARAMAVVAGLVTALAVAFGVVLVVGSPAGAFDALVTYNGAYRLEAAASAAGSVIPYAFIVLLPLVIPAAFAVITARRQPQHRPLARATTAWVLVGVLAMALQGRFYGHYALSIVVPLALLAAIGIQGIAGAKRRSRARLALLGVPVAVAVVLSLVVGGIGASMERDRYAAMNAKAATVAKAVTEHAGADDSLLVWGNVPRLYELADRRPATPYLYLYPLLTEGYVSEDRVEELANELASDPPAVVVDAGSTAPGQPGLPPLLEPRPVVTDGRDTDLLDPLRDFVRDRYVSAGEVAGWIVYVRSDRVEDDQ